MRVGIKSHLSVWDSNRIMWFESTWAGHSPRAASADRKCAYLDGFAYWANNQCVVCGTGCWDWSPAYIGSTPIATEMVVPVVIEGANKTESWFESTAAHSAELQSAEIRSLTLKSSAKGILLCSSHKRRIGCMLRQHSFSLRQPPVTLPMGGIWGEYHEGL